LKSPYAYAYAAFFYEETANASYIYLVILNFSATFSDVYPIGIRQFLAFSLSKLF